MVRDRIEQIREIVRTIVPEGEETIRYGMPTIQVKGKNVLHFAAYAKHVGFYPTPEPIEFFKNELKGYTTSKGAIQFPHDLPLPIDLIARISAHRIAQMVPGRIICSKKTDGNMQIKAGELAEHNRMTFCRKMGIETQQVVATKLINGTRVQIVDSSASGEKLAETDGLITTDPDLYLSITVADCLPVVIYSPGKVVALLHCGWRGLAGQIIAEAISLIVDKLGIPAHELSAMIGPGIEVAHYEIGAGVAEQFGGYDAAVTKKADKFYLDLKKVAVIQLSEAEINPKQIEVSEVCTYCDENLYSARRDKTDPVQAMMVLTKMS